ncbi:MAG: orotidine 5'-phosphate decarboxylase [Candidatus Bathyarchaeia archaeon]
MTPFQQKMENSAEKTRSKIVLALDLPPEKPDKLLSKSLSILEKVHEHICAVKLNHHLVLPLGLFNGVQKILDLAKDYELPTIMDCKINDIGETNRIIAQYYYMAGFDALTANPFVGWNEGLQPAFQIAKEMEKGILLLVYMSHKDSSEGYGQTIEKGSRKGVPQYVLFAQKAVEWMADGAVVGATYPEKIREVNSILAKRVPIYSPGVGAQGGDVETAVKAGAKYLIVGRSITLSNEPAEIAKRLRDRANLYERK